MTYNLILQQVKKKPLKPYGFYKWKPGLYSASSHIFLSPAARAAITAEPTPISCPSLRPPPPPPVRRPSAVHSPTPRVRGTVSASSQPARLSERSASPASLRGRNNHRVHSLPFPRGWVGTASSSCCCRGTAVILCDQLLVRGLPRDDCWGQNLVTTLGEVHWVTRRPPGWAVGSDTFTERKFRRLRLLSWVKKPKVQPLFKLYNGESKLPAILYSGESNFAAI